MFIISGIIKSKRPYDPIKRDIHPGLKHLIKRMLDFD